MFFKAIDRLLMVVISLALGIGLTIVSPAPAMGQSSNSNCPSDMTHYWKLNETPGQPYIDFITGTNNAACVTACPTWVTGIVGGAQQFDGAKKVDVADDDSYDWGPTQSFSIELWMKKSAASGVTEVTVGRIESTSTMYWWLGIDGTGHVSFNMKSGAPSPLTVLSATVVTDNNWHHVVVTRGGGTTLLYLDGVQEGTSSVTFITGFASTVPMNIGWFNLSPFYYFNGVLDEVATYNRALSLSEIQDHYNRGTQSPSYGYCGPVLLDIGSKSVDENVNLHFNVSATCPDSNRTLTLMATDLPPNATFVDNGDNTGTFDFNPDYTQAGVYNVTFTASDGASAWSKADTEIVEISVTNVSQPPVGTSKTVTATEDVDYTVQAADFGFTDPYDVPPNNFQSVVITSLPVKGTLKLSDLNVLLNQEILVSDLDANNLKYLALPNENGTAYASIQFKVRDDGSGANLDETARTMTINVTSVNDAPIGTSKTVTATQDEDYTVQVADFGFTDPNDVPPNNFLSVVITSLPVKGTLKLSSVEVTLRPGGLG